MIWGCSFLHLNAGETQVRTRAVKPINGARAEWNEQLVLDLAAPSGRLAEALGFLDNRHAYVLKTLSSLIFHSIFHPNAPLWMVGMAVVKSVCNFNTSL